VAPFLFGHGVDKVQWLISPTIVCQSLKLLDASTCDLPDLIKCEFGEFAAAPLGPVHFLSPDQEFGINCLIICAIQLLTRTI